MVIYADAKRESVPISKGFLLYRLRLAQRRNNAQKLHITLILESEILKPSNNQTIEYYHEVLTQINKL